jgi:tetratricopeptide (TPR) repeat protein
MSLVNDLLINLEERRGGHTDQHAVFADLSPAVGHEHAEVHTVSWWMLFVVPAIVVAMAGLWIIFQPEPVITSSKSIISNHTDEAQAAAPAVTEKFVATVEETGSDAIPSRSRMLDVMLSLKLDDVLRQTANETIVNSTLEPEPVADVVSQPLVYDKNKSPAGPVLRAVHISESNQHLELKLDLDGVPVYQNYVLSNPDRLVIELEKADYAVATLDWPTSPHIRKIRTGRHADQLRIVFDLNKPFVLADSNLIHDKDSSQLALSLVDPVAQASQPMKSASEANKQSPDQVVIENRRMEVRPRREAADTIEQDGDNYKIGLNLYQQGRFNESATALRQVVEQEPAHARAQYFLASALLYAGQLNAAEEQLRSALSHLKDNAELKRLYAHILMDQGKSLDALAVLADSPPAISSDIEYHALLAALLQEQQMHVEAADIYKNLVRLRPDNGVWWMGMGISLEALSLSNEALGAYRQALKVGTLPPNLSQYVSSRINTLSRDRS